MPSDLSSYLANHYLTADKKPTKKRKRNHASEKNGGLIITDDDDTGWSKPRHNVGEHGDGDEREAEVTVAGTSAEFRRSKKSSWKAIGAPVLDLPTTADADAAAADAILASAVAENEAARRADDEAPIVEDEDAGVVKMTDGTHAGLQSGASVAAQLRKRQREERAELERMRLERRAKGLPEDEGDETVYRDATGARIDISMKRAEARRAVLEAEERERAKKEALKGEVQIEKARRRREALEDAALMPLARGADDEEMNRQLREERRWNDPMTQFLTEKDGGADGTSGTKGATTGKRVRGRPIYKGTAPPNRYGIRPGYRWDGVDRGNGFEAERFKAINRREMKKGLDYAWQMDE